MIEASATGQDLGHASRALERDISGILEVEDAGKYMRTFMKETHRKPRMSMRDYLTQFEVAEDRMQKAIKQIVKDLDALSRRCRVALRVPSVSRRSLLVPRVPGSEKNAQVSLRCISAGVVIAHLLPGIAPKRTHHVDS